ncbi:MAG TPA: hypothetical protein VL523_19675 [Terriglobia bacterium]|nr:hypothetical protein [Terriglobia bacterium]
MKKEAKKQHPIHASAPSRRKFLGKMGTATLAAGVLGGAPGALAQPSQTAGPGGGPANVGKSLSGNRVLQALGIRTTAALKDAALPVPPHTTNGDQQRYSDHSASYSKGLLQDDICVVNPAAWSSFTKALQSGKSSDFEAIILGGTRTLNGPQGAYAFDLASADASQFGDAPDIGDPGGPHLVPPFDQVTSEAYGTQLVEMYWASLLRDVPFTDFPDDSTAEAACAELSRMPAYRGPRDSHGNVTPKLLFRGGFQGETIGPHLSQFTITPTAMGQVPMEMRCITYVPGVNYMEDTATFAQVQNGIGTGLSNIPDPTACYLHDFRGLAALTYIDLPLQEYITALCVMVYTLNIPVNPGSPYAQSKTQNGFCTFGGPDFAATMSDLTARALDHVWFQKWLVHLTHRPEWGGGLVHQILSGNGDKVQAHPNANVLNSKAVAESQRRNPYHTWLLSQAFADGSPAHPSYPTGHGTAGGAAITILKFFFDGNYVIPHPLVPSSDGLSLQPYSGSDAGEITVNTELNKIVRNVSFGHGVGAGIHWRSDTDQSMLLGEAMALSYLRDRANTYHEKFSINITKLDGTIVTISNE